MACACRGIVTHPVEVSHVKLAIAKHGWRGWGVQEKSDDRKTVGLCTRCHRTGPDAQHGGSERVFWDELGICPACLCQALSAAYDAGESGEAVIWAAVRARRLDGLPTC